MHDRTLEIGRSPFRPASRGGETGTDVLESFVNAATPAFATDAAGHIVFWNRAMEKLFDRQVPAASVFSGAYYFLEQLGFRKVIDSTFMMASLITGDPDPDDVRKYFRALRRAQRDIDLRPELYTHHYRKEFPERFHDVMDTRRWGPGERIVFEPYTKEVFEESFRWIAERGIFPQGEMGSGNYEAAVVSLAD